MKILFLLKKSYNYHDTYVKTKAAGLFNSAKFVSEILNNVGYHTHLEICVDGNEIDKYVVKYRPKVVIIEAIWVTPEKLTQLTLIHKKVQFIVRVHSNAPFLANEGIAIQWIKKYNHIPHVHVSFNNCKTVKDFNSIGINSGYLPNIYLCHHYHLHSYENMTLRLLKYKLANVFCNEYFVPEKKIINIGCFGAIRPLKNQFVQAMAAIGYADATDRILHFHINFSRVEQKGESTLKNIRALFEGTQHKLVEHDWMSHEHLLRLIRSIDLGLQVSMSESFNIVSADFVSQQIPIIVSSEIEWMPDICKVKSITSVSDIMEKISNGFKYGDLYSDLATEKLQEFNSQALEKWIEYLNHIDTHHHHD